MMVMIVMIVIDEFMLLRGRDKDIDIVDGDTVMIVKLTHDANDW